MGQLRSSNKVEGEEEEEEVAKEEGGIMMTTTSFQSVWMEEENVDSLTGH